MKSRIFNKSQAENKKLAAKYVLDAIAEPQFAEIVYNEPTGGPVDMLVGVSAANYGLVHITCSSSIDPNEKIWGWDPEGLKQCTNVNHVAFVWSDKEARVIVAILTKERAIELAEENDGQYSKQVLTKNAVKKLVVPATTLKVS